MTRFQKKTSPLIPHQSYLNGRSIRSIILPSNCHKVEKIIGLSRWSFLQYAQYVTTEIYKISWLSPKKSGGQRIVTGKSNSRSEFHNVLVFDSDSTMRGRVFSVTNVNHMKRSLAPIVSCHDIFFFCELVIEIKTLGMLWKEYLYRMRDRVRECRTLVLRKISIHLFFKFEIIFSDPISIQCPGITLNFSRMRSEWQEIRLLKFDTVKDHAEFRFNGCSSDFSKRLYYHPGVNVNFPDYVTRNLGYWSRIWITSSLKRL